MTSKNEICRSNPYHTEPIRLMEKKTHEAILSNTKAKNLIVFIHGFNGRAVSTWNLFPAYLCNDAKFAETDFVFYGYKSFQKKRGAGEYASDLLDFLKAELDVKQANSAIAKFVDEKKLETRQYEKIILAAHSLGAIVLRKALMGAHIDIAECPWIERTKMALFAPAHLGAKVDKLLFGTLDIIQVTKLIGLGLKYYYPVLRDLDSGSDLIKDLKDNTNKYLLLKEGDFTKSKLVIHSNPDGIVTNDRFCDDPQEIKISNSSHTAVCKPTNTYNDPVYHLSKLI